MSVLYVKEQGSKIRRIGERIIVSKDKQVLLDLPIFKIENLAVVGNVQVTTQAIRFLMENGVDISFMSGSGRYIGSAGANSSKNIFLRYGQFKAYENDIQRLRIARTITKNKIENQIQMIRDHRRKDPGYDWDSDIRIMKNALNELERKESINSIMGVEGICSQAYFGAFTHMLDCDIAFDGRNRRPPKDPVNAILSLGYTFLTREVSNVLDAESFETYLGFLHGIRYGRKSLALDIVEEFRQPVIDRFTLTLFNKRMLDETDFEIHNQKGVVLQGKGFKKFCSEYEKWMTGANKLSADVFRVRIHEQVAALKKSLCKHKDYQPYSWRNRHVCD